MGFRHAVVLSTSSFFLGVLFITFNVDYRLLWVAPTPEAAQAASQYYLTFYNAPTAVKNLLHSLMGVGLIGLISKLHKWDDSAMFFDGASLVAFLAAVVLYLSVTIPGLRTIVEPLETETESDRIETLRVIGAGNTMAIVCLIGVLAMQAGQEYARRYEQRELAKIAAEETVKGGETRKTK
ncbi:hypothetical protein FRC03_008846 [Tulasnella sp. 419]|nr:hypothetical protein FRC02_004157 [Tulasnella sp. 418]KAG8958750.1 hypothetical protein FRC03_008846 [Tulasnella sp. 419]